MTPAPSKPFVTVGVPVYRGERYVAEALESIRRQTYRNLEVLISLDGPDPASEAQCRPFLDDPRFRLVVQPSRLGWADHINWLMAQVQTPYWYAHLQDDIVDPRYVELLLDHAERLPEAAVVYCDIVAFGAVTGPIRQPSVTGSAPARLLTLLLDHHPAVAFRGLTRAEALHLAGGIPTNSVENASADTAWMAAVARWGDLVRLPLELYHKRYHADNTHTGWAAWTQEKRLCAWTVHCTEMLNQAMLVPASSQERRLLWCAAVARLVSSRVAFGYLDATNLNAPDRLRLLDLFLHQVRDVQMLDVPGWLGATWDDILSWTQGFYWLPPAL